MKRNRPLSPQARLLMAALFAEPAAWRYGYELARETGLGFGTLYPLLIRLCDQGLLEAEWRAPLQPGRPARHAYRLTNTGMAAAAALAAPEPSGSRTQPA